MLSKEPLSLLRDGKNLLAFSGGVDSTALFFLLLRENIPFDIAIVNYQTREQSSEETAYAQTLADKFGKECFILTTRLSEQNFEANARHARYDFFETVIKEHGSTNLLTAHQLDDRLEWLLMQLSKGAGLYELLGMQSIEQRDGYKLVRPLLETSKAELKTFLRDNSIPYFEDESNRDEKYKRNFFRHNIAAPLLEKYGSGIKKSFAYLNEDLDERLEQNIEVTTIRELHMFRRPASRRSAVIKIDRILKEHGFLMRQGDKESLKSEDEHVVGRRFVVSFHTDYCFIAPYTTRGMSKRFKEQCRLLGVPKKLRPYLFENEEMFEAVAALLKIKAGLA
ncbi:tRNA lysidine(34) synthetase TilS [Sulfurimonas sp. HSL3-7]|uniref:tRNA lysidine(34) synthetase TilS n=1 Tax=Sulfonitrofixus jiaomeiensis TaxID=3131938 RepID=UPI0031F8A077